ncbi:MAG: hypothetical protein AB1546_06905, partial [bacterium]
GLANIVLQRFVMNSFSIDNWLSLGDLDKETISKVKELHINGSELWKKLYQPEVVGSDVIIRVMFGIAVGECL